MKKEDFVLMMRLLYNLYIDKKEIEKPFAIKYLGTKKDCLLQEKEGN